MSYLQTLTEKQKENIGHILKSAKLKGITNEFTKAAILSIVSKESNFLPKNESGYSGTPNDRIRKIFGSKVSSYNEEQLTALKKDEQKFFDVIYGGRYGNATDEGYKFRGRGFNQLTFKNNYKKIAEGISVDIVADPEKMNQIEVSTLALIQFFLNCFKSCPAATLKHYNTTDINGFKTLEEAVMCVYHANAGWGKSVDQIKADPTGGLKKAKDRSTDLLTLVKSTK